MEAQGHVPSGSEPCRVRADRIPHTCGRLCIVPIAKEAGRSSPGPREPVGLKALVASSCQAGEGDLGTEEMSTGGRLAARPVYTCSLLADLAQQWVPSPWLTQHTGNPQALHFCPALGGPTFPSLARVPSKKCSAYPFNYQEWRCRSMASSYDLI